MVNREAIYAVGIAVVLSLSAIYIKDLASAGFSIADQAAGSPAQKTANSFLILKDENGIELHPDSITIDGKEFSGNKISLDNLPVGNKRILVRINGIGYEEEFNYNGRTVILIIGVPITAVVFAESQAGKALEGVEVYSDSSLKCITDKNGICWFHEKEGSHFILLQGKYLYKEELVNVDRISNSFRFEVQRRIAIDIKVVGTELGSPIKNAEVEVDGSLIGSTDAEGRLAAEVLEGKHVFTASYNGISEGNIVDIEDSKEIIIPIYFIPKKVYLEL